jgi:aspartyl protease family protein
MKFTKEQYQYLIFSSIGLSFVIAGYFSSNISFKKLFKDFAAWVVIFIVIVTGYSFKNDLSFIYNRVKSNIIPSEAIIQSNHQVIISKSDNGHFMINANVNGTNIYFLLDTGATDVAISLEDAEAIGLDTSKLVFNQITETANGTNYFASVQLPYIKIGSIEIRNVKAGVVKSGLGSNSLLGMSFLSRLSGFEVKDDSIILKQ